MKPFIEIDRQNTLKGSKYSLLNVPSNLTPADATLKPKKYSFKDTLNERGFNSIQRIRNALQGSVYRASVNGSNTNKYIVKVANKRLYEKSVAYVNGNQYRVREDIIKESNILKYLSANKPPQSLIGYIDCISDIENYFLILEDGGTCLFDFVKEIHEWIKRGEISISEWHKFSKKAIKQMVNVVDWMHNKMRCCHLDLSLENFVISDVKCTVIIEPNNTKKLVFSPDDFQIKLIDFGVAELFTSKKHFQIRKYVGKTGYKAPEVYAKTDEFDARSADCWSLAVCLFIMFTGHAPFHKPSNTDPLFNYIVNGQISEVLNAWGQSHYINDEILNLLLGLFQKEKYRLNVQEIKQHCWLNK